jgi:hypothetical protein
MVGQQNFAIISSAHGLFWIERIAIYFKIQNGSKCLSRAIGTSIPKPLDEVEHISDAESGLNQI